MNLRYNGLIIFLIASSCTSVKYTPIQNSEVDHALVARALQLGGNYMLSCDRNGIYDALQPIVATTSFIDKMTDKKRASFCNHVKEEYGEFKYATHIQANKVGDHSGDIAYRFKGQHNGNILSELRVTMTSNNKIRNIQVLDWKEISK